MYVINNPVSRPAGVLTCLLRRRRCHPASTRSRAAARTIPAPSKALHLNLISIASELKKRSEMEVVLLRKQSNLLLLWPMVCDASTHREIHRRNEAVPEGDTFFKFAKQTELFFFNYTVIHGIGTRLTGCLGEQAPLLPASVILSSPARTARATDTPSVAAYLPP